MKPVQVPAKFAVIAASLFVAGCSAGSGVPAVTPTAVVSPVGGCVPASTDGHGGPYPAEASSDCRKKSTVEVDIVDDPATTGAFAPSNLTISAGTTVRFVWKSSGHNLYPFHDGIEAAGYVVDKRFDHPGVYPYSCQVHPGQNGVVQVQ
jgi:plastocyanin